MLKYVDTKVVFQEIPDEITLAINISNCPCHCPGCHSSYLAEDIGNALQCGAHLTALRRTVVGPLQIDQAVTLDRLLEMTELERTEQLQAPDALLQTVPVIHLDATLASRFMHGNPVRHAQDGVIGF